MSQVCHYRVVQNYEEYLQVCKEVFLTPVKKTAFAFKHLLAFEDVRDWIDFFQIEELMHRSNEDNESLANAVRSFTGEVGLKPHENEYPVLITFLFKEADEPLIGMDSIVDQQVWDWVSLSKLNLQVKMGYSDTPEQSNSHIKLETEREINMTKVQISQAVATKIEELRNSPYYASQKDTDGAIIQAHAETRTPHSSWGKFHAFHDEDISTGELARALLIGYEVVSYK